MYELLGICLSLSALLAINAFASLPAAAAWRLIQRVTRNWSARLRAEILFTLRVAPPAVALVSVAAFLIPAFLAHEPYSTTEVVSKKLAVLSVVSASGVALALWRALRSWMATRRLLREWLANAREIQLAGVRISTFALSHSFPIIAVVGTMRPRLFIAERVLKSLNEEELKAAIAHECGHLSARDNLKRSLVRGCRDVLIVVPFGRSLDRAWAEAAECAADEHAAQEGARTALNLASALVKIARMIPASGHAAIPVAAFLVGAGETRGVKTRVRRLVEISSNDYRRRFGNSAVTKVLPALSVGSLLVISVMVAANSFVLAGVHVLIEGVVRVLC